jgi:hypothetical protein
MNERLCLEGHEESKRLLCTRHCACESQQRERFHRRVKTMCSLYISLCVIGVFLSDVKEVLDRRRCPHFPVVFFFPLIGVISEA